MNLNIYCIVDYITFLCFLFSLPILISDQLVYPVKNLVNKIVDKYFLLILLLLTSLYLYIIYKYELRYNYFQIISMVSFIAVVFRTLRINYFQIDKILITIVFFLLDVIVATTLVFIIYKLFNHSSYFAFYFIFPVIFYLICFYILFNFSLLDKNKIKLVYWKLLSYSFL